MRTMRIVRSVYWSAARMSIAGSIWFLDASFSLTVRSRHSTAPFRSEGPPMIRCVTSRSATALVLILLLAPAAVLAQGNTAMLNGVVTDESKSVLPGVLVTATDLSTGRPYQSVTDERGEYRMLNMAPGRYKVQSEVSGFATAVYPDVELIVGQNVTLPLTMKLGTIEESVTVSGQSPLVDTQSAAVAGYVDRR